MTDPIRLADYTPPPYVIDHVSLDFQLDFEQTEVDSRLRLRRHPDALPGRELLLHGEDLSLLAIAIDGQPLAPAQYAVSAEGLRLIDPPAEFELHTRVRIHPARNTRLEGLYQSSAFLLTQCEAEGFRRITYFLDRPDVMARFTVRLEADQQQFPVLLSNGDDVAQGTLANGRHFVQWQDPWPKPSYLFAIAAGALGHIEDYFRTRSGRDVRLRIYAEPRALPRSWFALDALKRSMRWDEARYGLEYDLDQFNIVATYDFNMGAMENKSLNIFNAKAIVADLERATDADLTYVEAVVAHEYFHNWTGNRVTCRDWFQLSLKEGLTVYRDQEFSADQGSRAVKRIDDVRLLRANQFPEDSGPFAHPVRPSEYVEINNFYTATVYEKGAEIVRLYERVLGREGFRRGMDLYFQRHDGQAVTTDDFRAAMADANGVDLSRFSRWYEQAGTPILTVTEQFDSERGVLTVQFSQETPGTLGQADKLPVPIPIPIALYRQDGLRLPLQQRDVGPPLAGAMLVLTEASQTLQFDGLQEKPVLSVLHDFSAPVALRHRQSVAELSVRLGFEQDPFCRFEAAQNLGEHLIQSVYAGQALDAVSGLAEIGRAFKALCADAGLDPAVLAECLNLPDEAYLSERMQAIDPSRLFHARQAVATWLGQQLEGALLQHYHREAQSAGGGFDAPSTAARRIRHRALALLIAGDATRHGALASELAVTARNMTERLAALSLLVHFGLADQEAALAQFYQQYEDDPLLLDKWLSVQASSPQPDALSRVRALLKHPAYTHRNPNKVRALIGTFGRLNRLHFHAADGSGYALYADALQAVDALNPQVAARLSAAFNGWRRFEPLRQEAMRRTLQRLLQAGLSKDSAEIVTKALEAS
ncbi:aminopeptidase N [Ahniella affigens]|uniref:Aminopeptidase N n=1 Tax=Ahniella affigens TaxID=2021234 RepID=A0A2P1PV29_9GAMM|nr:aminopeptidase N [Ahniella affigens]AVP98701.1 aminopeptidase N [Ahniella affigens]